MFGLSAVAVESEMVGKDSEAELIGGAAVVVPLAFCRAARAVGGSALNLGEVENSWLRRLGFEGALTAMPLFPIEDEVLEGSLARDVLADRRGIAVKRLGQGKRGHSNANGVQCKPSIALS
jgi:hypothetical protein